MTEVKVSGDSGENDAKSQWKPSLGDSLGSFQVNDCLIKLIHQFLLYNEFESTADSLVHEAPKLGFDVLAEHLCAKNAIPRDVCKAITSQYIVGDWRRFFNLWDHMIPQSIRETAEYKMLTFKLRLHFAVLPLRIKRLDRQADKKFDNVSKPQTVRILENAAETYFIGKEVDDNQSRQMMTEAMEQLRIYMETEGREFEERTELLPFFALTCLDDSQIYATFPELFDTKWMEDLTKTLQVFLMNRKQVRLTASQKTSTETMTTASHPYVCVKGNVVNVPLTCENLKDFEDKLLSINAASKVPTIPNDLPKVPMEITRSTIMGLIPRQMDDVNIEIVPNDRDIPMFRENQEFVEKSGSSPKHKSRKNRSAQTKITTVTTMTNFISAKDLCQPATILNSSIETKSPKSSSQPNNQELVLAKSHLCNVQCNYEKLKIRFHKLHSDYHKLLGIAGELTAALENSVRGEPIDLQTMLESCVAIFPDLFDHNVRGSTSETKALLDHESEPKRMEDHAESNRLKIGVNPVPPKLLDYKKIKFHLINGSVKTKLLLLQALRWKLTLSQPGDRDETINEYLRGDILGLHAQVACDSGKPILPYLLMPKDVATPHPLQQSAARLINAIASLRCGRDYLAIGATLLNLIVKCLNANDGEFIDAFTCDMIIAMLQKMSLRKQQRLYMIETGLVEWLVFHLKSESDRIGSYRLEYATALLMNLSLHKEAQIRASAMAPTLISLLITLLSTDHLPALPYINGSLNSFLSNKAINEEAKKIGLATVLEYHRKQNSGEIRKHIEHILKIHNRDYENETGDCETADDDNEELDVLEDELEEGDPVKVHPGELSGETLLAACYSRAPNNAQIEGVITVLEARPKTPKMHSRTNSIKSSGSRQKNLPNERLQTPTRDTGSSPRKEIARLKPAATSPVRSLLPFDTPTSMSRLTPDKRQGISRASPPPPPDYPSLSEIFSHSIDDAKLRAALTMIPDNSASEVETRLSKKLRTSTCSPYFSSFTRTYEPKKTSDKSVQPTLASINSQRIVFRDERTSTESRESKNYPKYREMNNNNRSRERLNSSDIRTRNERKMKSVRLKYSGESDSSDVAVCLYANESSKGSSKTTLASSGMLGTNCNSVTAETERLSSIASLDEKTTEEISAEPNENEEENLDMEIDAFLAKPKLPRTPPSSARPELQSVQTLDRRVSTD